MSFKVAPLNSTFMAVSILGFLISVFYVPKWSIEWATAFGILFFLMFVASMISMAKAMPDAQLAARPKVISGPLTYQSKKTKARKTVRKSKKRKAKKRKSGKKAKKRKAKKRSKKRKAKKKKPRKKARKKRRR